MSNCYNGHMVNNNNKFICQLFLKELRTAAEAAEGREGREGEEDSDSLIRKLSEYEEKVRV